MSLSPAGPAGEGEEEGEERPLASRRAHYPASAAGGLSAAPPMAPRRARLQPIAVSAGGAGAGGRRAGLRRRCGDRAAG